MDSFDRPNEKTCWDCKETKPIEEFPKDTTRGDGYAYQCRVCYRAKKREYERDRYNSDIVYKTNRKRKRRINDLLRSTNPDSESKILGYSKRELMDNITSKFLEGMSWDNYGKWHIDHIIPLVDFDPSVDDKIVSNLNNLQPLWAKDNIRKSNSKDIDS